MSRRSLGIGAITVSLTLFMAIGFAAIDKALAESTSIAFSGLVKDGGVSLSYDQLAALPKTKLVEKIQASSDASAFEGPTLEDVLKLVEAKGNSLHLSALDDYAVDLPLEIVAKFHPILAIRRDGKPISVDKLGPYLIMFPYAEHPEINNDEGWSWAVWQLNKIAIK